LVYQICRVLFLSFFPLLACVAPCLLFLSVWFGPCVLQSWLRRAYMQGLSDSLAVMDAAVKQIPRDQDNDAEHWTTVDLDRTNVRLKMVSRLLKGFQIFLGLVGKNLLYSHAVESRFRDLLIVCNVQASNGPIDEDGLYYLANAQSSSTSSGGSSNHRRNRNAEDAPPRKTRRTDALQQMEDELDKEADREGVVRFGSNSSSGVIKVCVCVCACVRMVFGFVCYLWKRDPMVHGHREPFAKRLMQSPWNGSNHRPLHA
jgi:hypothetical protein